jgi:hypothetical protein
MSTVSTRHHGAVNRSRERIAYLGGAVRPRSGRHFRRPGRGLANHSVHAGRRIEHAKIQQVLSKPTTSLAAYDCWLRGMAYFKGHDENDNRNAYESGYTRVHSDRSYERSCYRQEPAEAPCIRQTVLPLTAGTRHFFPRALIRALHRGARFMGEHPPVPVVKFAMAGIRNPSQEETSPPRIAFGRGLKMSFTTCYSPSRRRHIRSSMIACDLGKWLRLWPEWPCNVQHSSLGP